MPDSTESPEDSARSARFQTTRWTLMSGAGDPAGRDAAWDHFCRAYWYPVYAFVRRRGAHAEEARDLTQAFFEKLLAQDWLAQVERRESRFSTLLIAILKNFLIKRHHHDAAQKRGGGRAALSLDLAQAENWFGLEPEAPADPDLQFERRWARAVMDAALHRLRAECDLAGKTRLFTTLGPFLSREPGPGDYEAAGAALGIHARSVAVAVHRLRSDYRAMVREEVAAGLRDGALLEEELRALAAALGA